MITDPRKDEINLLKALKELSDTFNDDATCMSIGIQQHLRNHHVGSYVPKIAKVLKKMNVIKYNPNGTHKNPLIYWHSDVRPSLKFCREVFNQITVRQRPMGEMIPKEEIDKIGEAMAQNAEIQRAIELKKSPADKIKDVLNTDYIEHEVDSAFDRDKLEEQRQHVIDIELNLLFGMQEVAGRNVANAKDELKKTRAIFKYVQDCIIQKQAE